MSYFKDLYLEAFEEITSEAEEAGTPITDTEAGEKAHNRALDHFFAACDEAKGRAKYREEPVT
jgi:hypothetical protein